jgi:hypothetical protein
MNKFGWTVFRAVFVDHFFKGDKMDLNTTSGTVAHVASPIAVIVLVEAAYAALQSAGINVDKSLLMQIAMIGYGGVMGLIHFFSSKAKAATPAAPVAPTKS